MITSLLAFLGGSAFRMMWGEVSHWITEARDHRREIERMREQETIDAATHARNLESIRLQHSLGVEVIRVKADEMRGTIETEAWGKLVEGTTRTIGIAFIDAWNAAIRPAVATWAIVGISGHYLGQWALDENGWAIAGAALGIYLADRALFKRGK